MSNRYSNPENGHAPWPNRQDAEALRLQELALQTRPKGEHDVLIAQDAGVAKALTPLLGAISVEAMREANLAVDREDAEKLTPKAAAAELAKAIGL